MNETHRPGCYCRQCRGDRVANQRRIERENPVSRTDDLRAGGNVSDRTGGGGGGAPFVKWPKDTDYAWVEGRLTKIWTGKYGATALLTVSAASKGLSTKGKNEEGQEVMGHATPGDEVNVGLNSSALEGTLSQDDVGQSVHVAFEGWEESKGGNQYRLFTVFVMPERTDSPRSAEGLETAPASDPNEPWPEAPDDDLGF